jgi:hypothetical protein
VLQLSILTGLHFHSPKRISACKRELRTWRQRYGRVNEHNGWIPRAATYVAGFVQSIVGLGTRIFQLMRATARRGVVTNRCRLPRNAALSLCCWLCVAALQAQVEQSSAVLGKIHQRLTNVEKLSYHRPIVFVGDISSLGAVPRGVCKSAVSQSVDFSVSRWLFASSPRQQNLWVVSGSGSRPSV